MENKLTGGFTLPGEVGYEKLTLELAERWGTDAIRDSDGTQLSPELLNAGVGIYSTICIIRNHNTWIKANPHTKQQAILSTEPVVAKDTTLEIELLKDFFGKQFSINPTTDSLKYWQVFDRTTGEEISRDRWQYNKDTGSVFIQSTVLYHSYTVSFFAYRIWEEISMYNHTTNDWDSEHLMQIDPIYPEAMEYMKNWLENWCKAHTETTVIRFTSLFYNFAWFWGAKEENRTLFVDWASYDFTVSPLALDEFENRYGYSLTCEDFVNKGFRHATHLNPNQRKRDWMEFITDRVLVFGKELIDIAHKYDKKAYVFYDDSWVGIEPYSGRFGEYNFDGLIKAVFSAFEVRLCAGVKEVETHELRFHPYLFPVNLRGEPTFLPGGDPVSEARDYWINVRRGLLRAPIQRIGLGGYLHLVEDFPDFVDYIEEIATEFRQIRELHSHSAPYNHKATIGILTSWGKLRSWTCSGHFHEQPELDLLNLIESIAGLPFDVEFLDFNEIKAGALDNIDILINAGVENSAWSGGDNWKDANNVSTVTRWVDNGGVFIGVNQPSAYRGANRLFRLAETLGVDYDTGECICHGRWPVASANTKYTLPEVNHNHKEIFLINDETIVLENQGDNVTISIKNFGKGKGVYLASYRHSFENAGKLHHFLLELMGEEKLYASDNLNVEVTFFPKDNTYIFTNTSDSEQKATIKTKNGTNITKEIEPYGLVIEKI